MMPLIEAFLFTRTARNERVTPREGVLVNWQHFSSVSIPCFGGPYTVHAMDVCAQISRRRPRARRPCTAAHRLWLVMKPL